MSEGTYTTLLGALFGFLASLVVLYAQRKLDSKAKEKADGRSRSALARAMREEITRFQTAYFSQICMTIRQIEDPTGGALQPLKVFPTASFPLYLGNVSKIGEFRPETLIAVVSFYTSAREFMETLEMLKASHTWEVEKYKRVEARADCVKQFEKLKQSISGIESSLEAARSHLERESLILEA